MLWTIIVHFFNIPRHFITVKYCHWALLVVRLTLCIILAHSWCVTGRRVLVKRVIYGQKLIIHREGVMVVCTLTGCGCYCRQMSKCSNRHAENVLLAIVTRTTVQLENNIHNASAAFARSEKRVSVISSAAAHLRQALRTIILPSQLQKVSAKLNS